MFTFIEIVDDYEQGDLVVDTVAVNDATEPYETGIRHPKYNNGKWVIVETYNTKELAQVGHDKWVAVMTAETLPTKLMDRSTAAIAKMCDNFDGDWRERKYDDED
jgi:hypothetical protein